MQELGAVLAAHGYPASRRTFFIWEAVTQYLSEDGIRATFNFLAQAAPGSRLAFTYIRKDFIDGQARVGQGRLPAVRGEEDLALRPGARGGGGLFRRVRVAGGGAPRLR